MHGFNLGLESVMAGHFAKTIAVQAQQVATFIRASPPAAAAVAKAAELERLSGKLFCSIFVINMIGIKMLNKIFILYSDFRGFNVKCTFQ